MENTHLSKKAQLWYQYLFQYISDIKLKHMISKTQWSFVYKAATQIKWEVHVQYFRWQNLNPLLLFLTCQVFLASKYVEKLMEMTFMFKNTRGSYTWYPSNMEVMRFPRHQRVDVSSSKKREYLRKFRMDLLEGLSVTIALTIWRRKAFQKRGGEKDTCTNTIGKEIWKITTTNLKAVSVTSRTFYD